MQLSKFNVQSIAFSLVIFFLMLMSSKGGDAAFGVASSVSNDPVAQTSLVAEELPEAETAVVSQHVVHGRRAYIAAEAAGAHLIAFARPEPLRITIEEPPEFHGAAAFIKELESNTELFVYNPTRRWPLASLTKLMTTVVASEQFNPDRIITVDETSVETPGIAGGFHAGERYKASDLIAASLAISSNDAAVALARSFGSGAFLEAMRAKANALALTDTTFADPAGLSVLSQSTVRDIARLAEYVLDGHPELFAYTDDPSVLVTELTSGAARVIRNNNLFAGRTDFVGGKTGYTDEANGNLLSIFRRGKNTFLIVVFGTDDRFGETETLYKWAERAVQ